MHDCDVDGSIERRLRGYRVDKASAACFSGELLPSDKALHGQRTNLEQPRGQQLLMIPKFLNTDLGCLPACGLFPSRRDHRSICDRSYATKDSSQEAGHMWMAVHAVATHSSCHSLFTAF